MNFFEPYMSLYEYILYEPVGKGDLDKKNAPQANFWENKEHFDQKIAAPLKN